MTTYELAVDFMDMTNDRRLWTRLEDARAGFAPVAGRYVIVGCDDDDSGVAQILSVNSEATSNGAATRNRRLPPRSAHAHLII